MNIVYIVGIVMAFFFTVFGIVVGFDMSTLQFSFSIGNLSNFVDLSSILIVIGGTLAVVVACYPKQIRSLPKHFKIMLHSNTFDPQVYVDQLTELAQIARKNGLLALEEKGNEQENSFFKQAIMLVVDNNDRSGCAVSWKMRSSRPPSGTRQSSPCMSGGPMRHRPLA